jgi:HK97 family phage major capsid protein
LVPVANELIADAGFDISSLIAEASGNAIGFAVNNDLTVGTGTVQPTGVVTAAGAGITGSTAVAGAFTVIGQHYMEKMLKKIEQPKPEDVTTEAIVQS